MRSVRRKAYVPQNAVAAQTGHVVENSAAHDVVEVAVVVYAVQKTEIDVVGAQRLHFPGERFLYLGQIARPSVFSGGIIHGAEVQLKIQFFPSAFDRPAERLVYAFSARAEVKKVYSVCDRRFGNRADLFGRSGMQTAGSDAEYSDFFAAVRQFSVFHVYPSSVPRYYIINRTAFQCGQACRFI